MTTDVRASDDDRERVVAALQRHTAAGRLTLDEFAERVGTACGARTLAELAVVTGDLPAEPEPDGPEAWNRAGGGHGVDPGEHGRRELLLVFAVAAVTLLLLGLAFALVRS